LGEKASIDLRGTRRCSKAKREGSHEATMKSCFARGRVQRKRQTRGGQFVKRSLISRRMGKRTEKSFR